MLSDTCRDDHVVFPIPCLGIKLLDDLLRLHLLAGSALVIRERVLGFPLLDVLEPALTR